MKLRDRIAEYKQEVERMRADAATDKDQGDLAGQLRTEKETSGELRSSIEMSESKVVMLTSALEEKAAELERFHAKEGQLADTQELQYYRSLEAECVKWEAREKRALGEMDRLCVEAREETRGMDSTLSAAKQQHQDLQGILAEKEILVGQLARKVSL